MTGDLFTRHGLSVTHLRGVKIKVIFIIFSTHAGLNIDFFIQDNAANTLFS